MSPSITRLLNLRAPMVGAQQNNDQSDTRPVHHANTGANGLSGTHPHNAYKMAPTGRPPENSADSHAWLNSTGPLIAESTTTSHGEPAAVLQYRSHHSSTVRSNRVEVIDPRVGHPSVDRAINRVSVRTHAHGSTHTGYTNVISIYDYEIRIRGCLFAAMMNDVTRGMFT